MVYLDDFAFTNEKPFRRCRGLSLTLSSPSGFFFATTIFSIRLLPRGSRACPEKIGNATRRTAATFSFRDVSFFKRPLRKINFGERKRRTWKACLPTASLFDPFYQTGSTLLKDSNTRFFLLRRIKKRTEYKVYLFLCE